MGSYCSCLNNLIQNDSENLTRDANYNNRSNNDNNNTDNENNYNYDEIIKKNDNKPIEIPFQHSLSNSKKLISFRHFLSSSPGLNLCSNKQKEFPVKLHKFLVGYLIRKRYKKSMATIEKQSSLIYQDYIKYFYSKIEILQKEEIIQLNNSYNKEGYKAHYSINNQIGKNLSYRPKKNEAIDNVIICYYCNNNIDNTTQRIQPCIITEDDELIKSITGCYQGQINYQNQPHGYGIFFNPRKKILKQQGYWINGQFTGWNFQIDINGIVSTGTFVNGSLNGFGIMINVITKTKYKGNFLNDKREGEGVDESFLGVYKGTYVNNMKEGKGIMQFKSGDFFEGEYHQDQFHGQGHFKWGNTGYEYIGEYKNGLMDGNGLYKWNEKEYYKGEFAKGIKEGIGEMKWANGRRFIGPFKNGKPHGIGVFDNGLNMKTKIEFIDGKMKKEKVKDNKNFNQNDSTLNSLNTMTMTHASLV